MWRQLVTPNLNEVGTVGGCLAYARTSFGAPGGVDYAWQAWENATLKHTDQSFPGVAVPVWFSYMVNELDEGHVVIWVPGQGFYSSPYTTRSGAQYQVGTGHAVLTSISEIERIYGVSFVGWSEDINGVQVAESEPDVPVFTTSVTPFSGQYTVNPGMHKWNLDLATFDAIDNNPITYIPPDPITFTAQLTRSDIPQFTYYLEDANVHQGYNSLDVTAYTPPPPIVVVSKPYVAPAAPEPVVRSQKYEVHIQLKWYLSSPDAQFKRNPQGSLPVGDSYYRFATGDSTVQLGPDNMHSMWWINTKDNIAPVVIPVKILKPSEVPIGSDNDTKWKATYKSFHIDRTSDPYTLLQEVLMKEYSAKRDPVQLYKGNPINLVGTFVKDGIAFYRARDFKNDEYFDWYYGISMYNDDGQPNVVKVTEDIAVTAERKLRDYYRYWRSDFKEIFDIMFKKGKI